MQVKELMTADVVTIGRNDELSVADDIMKMKRVRHLPVLEEGRLVGVLSQRDLFLAALSTAMGFGQKASQEFLKTVPVKEVMTGELITVAPSDDVTAAAHLMIDHKIGCLPVVDDGKLVGLLTESDFVKLALSDS
jgi:CBS domain-containing protein